MLQEPLLALASEIEHGEVTMMLVPRAALVQDCEAEAPLRVWGAIADKQVCSLRPLCPATVALLTSNSHDTSIRQSLAEFACWSRLQRCKCPYAVHTLLQIHLSR